MAHRSADAASTFALAVYTCPL